MHSDFKPPDENKWIEIQINHSGHYCWRGPGEATSGSHSRPFLKYFFQSLRSWKRKTGKAEKKTLKKRRRAPVFVPSGINVNKSGRLWQDEAAFRRDPLWSLRELLAWKCSRNLQKTGTVPSSRRRPKMAGRLLFLNLRTYKKNSSPELKSFLQCLQRRKKNPTFFFDFFPFFFLYLIRRSLEVLTPTLLNGIWSSDVHPQLSPLLGNWPGKVFFWDIRYEGGIRWWGRGTTEE